MHSYSGTKHYSLFFLSLICLLLPGRVDAAELLKNTGLIPSTLWYSKDPFYTGDKIRIYSVIFNGSAKDLRGKINFYNNNSSLCSSDFSSLSGRVSEVWCDWKVPAGKNSISVKIVNPRASAPGEEEQDVILANSELSVSERVVVEAPKPIVIVENNQLRQPADGGSENPSGIAGIVSGGGALIQKLLDFVDPPDSPKEDTIKSIDSAEVEVATEALKSVNPKNVSVLDEAETKSDASGVFSNDSEDETIIGGFLSRNLVGLYPTLLSIRDAFNSFTASVADRVLPKLKSFSETDNKPLAAVLSFFYGLVKFIFDYPLVFASLILALLWKIFDLITSRRDY